MCRPFALDALGLLAALLLGCECDGGGESGSGGAGRGTGESPTRARTGTIVGIVRLAPGAELPAYPQHPLQIEGRPAIPETCTPPRTVDRSPVVVSEETGGLVGLAIVATGQDTARWPRPSEPRTHEVAIRDCRLTPRIIVATRGDRLRLVNETDYPFFPDLGEGMLQYRTEPRVIELDEGGVRTIQCGFAAPCGRLELITLYHPVHTTSGEDGRFRIEDVPADEPIRVTAWHPLFTEAATDTTVPAGGQVEVELEIRPAPIELPSQPSGEGARRGPAEENPDVLF
jgi:hypothetical protein